MTDPSSGQQDHDREKFAPRSAFMELVEYDRKALTMDIHFRSGTSKRYLFCFPATFQTFKESPSHDTFFSKVIRGRLVSLTVRSHTIGREVSHPLKAVKKRRTLDHGVKQWTAGTVARAGL